MAVGKEIKEQITSVKSTQKITSAMEKVAVSKMRRAQARMASSRPYADRIRVVIGHLANATSEYRHRYLLFNLFADCHKSCLINVKLKAEFFNPASVHKTTKLELT